MKENISPNVLTYVKSATQSKKALVLGFLNQAMPENPLRTNLKTQISRSYPRCTKSALVGARPHSLFKRTDSNVVYVLVTNENAFN